MAYKEVEKSQALAFLIPYLHLSQRKDYSTVTCLQRYLPADYGFSQGASIP